MGNSLNAGRHLIFVLYPFADQTGLLTNDDKKRLGDILYFAAKCYAWICGCTRLFVAWAVLVTAFYFDGTISFDDYVIWLWVFLALFAWHPAGQMLIWLYQHVQVAFTRPPLKAAGSDKQAVTTGLRYGLALRHLIPSLMNFLLLLAFFLFVLRFGYSTISDYWIPGVVAAVALVGSAIMEPVSHHMTLGGAVPESTKAF